MKSSTFVTLVVVAVCAASAAAQTTAPKKPGNRIFNCPIDAKSLDECDAEAYLLRAAMYLVPPLLFGVLTILFCPFYFCGRFVCNCCGGRMPTRGCCCACGEEEPRYSIGERFRPKFYVTLLLIASIVATPWALAGATELTTGVSGFFADIENVPVVIGDLLDLIHVALTTTKYNFVTDEVEIVDLYASGGIGVEGEKVKKILEDNIQGVFGSYNSYVDQASTAMFVMSVVPFACLVIGTLAGWLNIRHCIPTLLLIIMFLLFGPATWIVHGVSGVGGVIFGDICAEIHGMAVLENNVATALMNCQPSMFRSFNEAFGLLENAQAFVACSLLQATCFDQSVTSTQNAQDGKIYSCPSNFACDINTVTYASVLKVMQGATVHADIAGLPNATAEGWTCIRTDMTLPCSVDECSDLCVYANSTRSMVGKLSRGIKVHVNAAGVVASSKDTLASSFASCDSLPQLVLGPFDNSCKAITNGFVALHNAFGLSAITTVAFLFVMVWGSKRFVSGVSDEEIADAKAKDAGAVPDEEGA
jgi:hypothetical protein